MRQATHRPLKRRAIRAIAWAGALAVNLSFVALLTSAPPPGEPSASPARRFQPVSVVVRAVPLVAAPPVAAARGPAATSRRDVAPQPITPGEVGPPRPAPPPFTAATASPSPSASAPLLLDDTTLRQARAAARQGGVGAMADPAGVPLSTAPSPAEQRAETVQRALRPDCRSAHAGKGIFAVPFLLRDAVAGDGCKW